MPHDVHARPPPTISSIIALVQPETQQTRTGSFAKNYPENLAITAADRNVGVARFSRISNVRALKGNPKSLL